jgi:hypothetical protein
MEFVEPYTTILVLNSSFEPIHFVNWKRAVILLFKEKAKLISKRIIRLINYVKIPFVKVGDICPSRSMVYKRDNYECQYCGIKQKLTIDHVVPRSKGGKDTWQNLVACCEPCNLKKGNKLLRETDMKLKSIPKAPSSKIMLDLENTKVSEWKNFIFI